MINRHFYFLKKFKKILPNKAKLIYYKNLDYREQTLTNGEMEFFQCIKPDLKIMIDIGPRTDTYYADNSENLYINYFEANPIFCRILSKKLSNSTFNYRLENIGISDNEDPLYYYHSTQSFLELSAVGTKSNTRSSSRIQMRTLDSFGFENVDFLKMDLEEMDYFALKGAAGLLPKIRYLQFELGLAKVGHQKRITNEDYISLLTPNFDLYLLKDEKNVIWRENFANGLLLKLERSNLKILKILQSCGIGFNVVGINRSFKDNPVLNKLIQKSWFN